MYFWLLVCNRNTCLREKQTRQEYNKTVHTFDFGFEVWVRVQHRHLLLPVKLIPPVGHHPPEIRGVEAVLEATVLQGLSKVGSVDAVVQVLLKKTTMA